MIFIGLIVCFCVFLTWATIHVDLVFSASNELTGIELFDNQDNLRYCPIVTLFCGFAIIVFSIMNTILKRSSIDRISMVFLLISTVASIIFIVDAPLEESIAGVMYHNVTVDIAPFIVLIASIIGLLVLILPFILGDTTYFNSLGYARSVKTIVSSAGFTIDPHNNIVHDSQRFGHVYGTYIRIYDLDLTYDAIPHAAVSSISLVNGQISVSYNPKMMPKGIISPNSDNTISGRGR